MDKYKTLVKCCVCGNDYLKSKYDLKRYPNHCCSKGCRAKFNNKRIEVKCAKCGKSVLKPPSLIKGKKNIFCSKWCADTFMEKLQPVICDYCGKPFKKQLSLIKRSRYSFCSAQCRGKFVVKKSFIEEELEKLVKPLDIEYDRNNREMIAPQELDFYFPELNYAVEINGKCHYEPLYGNDVLKAQKKRDRRKRKKCKKINILLRVVKPGNCKNGVYLKRLKRVVWEIKQRMKNVRKIEEN